MSRRPLRSITPCDARLEIRRGRGRLGWSLGRIRIADGTGQIAGWHELDEREAGGKRSGRAPRRHNRHCGSSVPARLVVAGPAGHSFAASALGAARQPVKRASELSSETVSPCSAAFAIHHDARRIAGRKMHFPAGQAYWHTGHRPVVAFQQLRAGEILQRRRHKMAEQPARAADR